MSILILLNLVLIYLMSAQNGTLSEQTSHGVSVQIAETFVTDYEEKTPPEKEEVILKIHAPVRKVAHMIEFGMLGVLSLALLLTWKGGTLTRIVASLGFVLAVAVSDELHQTQVEGRGAQLQDILIDFLGAIIACSLFLCLYFLIRKRKRTSHMRIQVTNYKIQTNGIKCRLAVASDLHGMDHSYLLELLAAQKPDLILIPGDLTYDEALRDEQNKAYDFLEKAAKIAPTYYSLGNHEIACYHKGNPWRHPTPIPLTPEIKARIAKTGAVLLDNESVSVGELTVCGLTSGINGKRNEPNREVLDRFSKECGYRILLCHHPEYFMPYVRKTDIELTLCGHAHGGQWRWFGKGTYAPGQGIFPKYTSGVLENRCVISRGLGNHTMIPRIFNKPELVVIDLE